jgi:hypothetical protein
MDTIIKWYCSNNHLHTVQKWITVAVTALILITILSAFLRSISTRKSFAEFLFLQNRVSSKLFLQHPVFLATLLTVFSANAWLSNANVINRLTNQDIECVPSGTYCYTAKYETSDSVLFQSAEVYIDRDKPADQTYKLVAIHFFNNETAWIIDEYFTPEEGAYYIFDASADVTQIYITVLNTPAYIDRVKTSNSEYDVFGDIITFVSLFCAFIVTATLGSVAKNTLCLYIKSGIDTM